MTNLINKNNYCVKSIAIFIATIIVALCATSSASAKITDGYTSGKKIHMVAFGNGKKPYLGFIFDIDEKDEDVLILSGKYSAAYQIYLKKSNAGDVDASHNLGLMYLRGLGVDKDIEKSMFYLEKSMTKLSNFNTAAVFYEKAKKELVSNKKEVVLSTSKESVASGPTLSINTINQQPFVLPKTNVELSSISRKIYDAKMEESNDQWMQNPDFMADLAKTDGSDEAINNLKHSYALNYLSEGITLAKIKLIIPSLAGLSDADAFDAIHSMYYSKEDKAELAKYLGYTPQTIINTPALDVTGKIAFWFLIFFGVIGYLKMRSTEKNLGSNLTKQSSNSLVGVKGWLMIFVIFLGILGPALSLGKLAGSIFNAEKSILELAYNPAWTTYKNNVWLIFTLFSTFSIYSALQLRFVWKPASVALAKIALVSSPIANLLIGIIIQNPNQSETHYVDFVGTLLASIGSFIIWMTYLSMSKRVRATFTSDLINTAKSTVVQSLNKNTPDFVAPNHGLPIKPTIIQTGNNISPSIKKATAEDELYEKIGAELDSGNTHLATWLKAFSQSDGNENVAKAKYIKYRIEQFKELH